MVTADPDRYLLAQVAKAVRLGLVEPDGHGGVRLTAAASEMDAPIRPDPVDFAAVGQPWWLDRLAQRFAVRPPGA